MFLYGGGSRGRVAIGFLANQGIKPDYVIDLSPEKRNTYLLGIQIISPKDLVDCLDEKYEYIVAAATDFYLFPYDQNAIILFEIFPFNRCQKEISDCEVMILNIHSSNADVFYRTTLGRKILGFGAGKMAVDAVHSLEIRDSIDFFCDNSKEKQGKAIGAHGKSFRVENPEIFHSLKSVDEYVLLIINRDYSDDILKQCQGIGELLNIDVFIYKDFDLNDIYAYQKTKLYVLMKDYARFKKLGWKDKAYKIAQRLIEGVSTNTFFEMEFAKESLPRNKVEALRVMTRIYNKEHRKEILEEIRNNFRFEKINRKKDIYEKNLNLLKAYPYFFSEDIPTFQNYEYVFESEVYFVHYAKEKFFGKEISLNNLQTDCNFPNDTGKPVLLEDVYDWNLLKQLNVIFRESERIKRDNHIYLLYNDEKNFHVMLHFVPMEDLLKDKKIVVLVGSSAKQHYPMQFTYEGKPEPLQIEEMQRICILISNGDCGSGFFTGVMDANTHVISNEDKYFYYYSNLDFQKFHQVISDTEKRYTFNEVVSVLESYISRVSMPMGEKSFRDYVVFFKENFSHIPSFNSADMWKAYFIAKYYFETGTWDTRYVPLVFWDIHNGRRASYMNMLKEFAVQDFFAPVRHPVTKLVRSYDRRLFGKTSENHYDDLRSRFVSGFNQEYSYPFAFEKKYFVAKFEDCKLRPKEMFQKICHRLCIPFQERMLLAEAPESGNIHGEDIKGFDLIPLQRKIDHVFSSFDNLRLEMFYSQILEHYEYEYFNFNEHNLSDDDVKKLFSIPLRMEEFLFDQCYSNVKEDTEWTREFDYPCEEHDRKMYFQNKGEIRAFLYDIMVNGYKISRYGTIRFPYFVRSDIKVRGE